MRAHLYQTLGWPSIQTYTFVIYGSLDFASDPTNLLPAHPIVLSAPRLFATSCHSLGRAAGSLPKKD